jgi:hypothetical protein
MLLMAATWQSRQHITGCSAPFGRSELAIDQ